MSKASLIFFLFALSSCVSVWKTDKHAAYRVFTSSGKQLVFEEVLKEAGDKKVILFGEEHDNTVAHWLQLRMLEGLIDTTANKPSVWVWRCLNDTNKKA